MNKKSYLSRIVLAVLLLAVCMPMLWGQTEMAIVYDGEYTLESVYRVAGTQGDSLALFKHQIQDRQYRIIRQKVVPVFGSQTPETVFTYDIDPTWGAIGAGPSMFQFRNGKLYSAIMTATKMIVFFTDATQTDVHIFDRTGISNIGYYSDEGESGFVIRDESVGYFSSFQMNPFLYRYYMMDFATDTLQMFYQNNELLYFYFLNENYVLMTTRYTQIGGSILVDGATVIQVFGAYYLGEEGGSVLSVLPFGSTGNQLILADVLFPVQSDGQQSLVDSELPPRNLARNQLTNVQNQSLQFMEGELGGYGREFIPQNEESFSCRVINNDQWGLPYSDTFKKFYISAGQIYPDPSFPNLSNYSNPWMLKAMGTSYLLAICGTVGQPLSFVLADYARQFVSVKSYDLGVSSYPNTQFYTSSQYLYAVNSTNVKMLHRDIVTAVSDELAPVAPIGITAYPNPFSGVCKIAIDGSKNVPVSVSIYNIKGQLTKTLCNGMKPLGDGALQWDGRNEQNQRAAAGVYWIKVDIGTASATRKIVLMH
ncbi:MAG: hypothetical protein CVU48_05075 [Candidatus Cloacimonetes bacterium HGW-Cloacimonetes-1]|jgi:hypothetical protein|nr:MAG: hypothetical protein CVU48_05075 [Candidatus Cloacimonetes bacterium HGW-Cloacimonetes-1]